MAKDFENFVLLWLEVFDCWTVLVLLQLEADIGFGRKKSQGDVRM